MRRLFIHSKKIAANVWLMPKAATTVANAPSSERICRPNIQSPASVGAFNMVWWNATDYGDSTEDPLKEIVRVTARTGDVLTVSRAQEGTSAVAHNIAGKTYKLEIVWTEKLYNDIINAIGVRVNDILDGPTSYKRVTIAGVTPSSDAEAAWGTHDQTDPGVNFSPPIGAVYISEVGTGYVDVRSNAFEGRDRRIKVKVIK